MTAVGTLPPYPATSKDPDPSARAALGVFVVALIGAFAFYLVVGQRDYWFRGDDWGMFVSHDGANLSDLFHEVHDHWSTVPIIVYRVFFNLFGLRYLPFLVLVVLAHVAIAVLLRVIMRRVGVGPWIATAVATMFVLLGASGWNNIVWAFQIGFDGSVLFGLTMVLLTDHDGAFDRRDAIGIACGLGALMCSGVGVAMVAIVGLAALIRRGWRLALVFTVPLASVYLVWYFSLDRRSYRDSGGRFAVTDVAGFVGRGLSHTLTRDVRVTGGMLLLLAILIAGLVRAWTKVPRDELRRRAAVPAAMLVGAAIFLIVVGAGRGPSLTTQYATTTRFVHVTTALLAPALAVAADSIARRWPVTLPVLCALFVVGAPANLSDMRLAAPNYDHDLIVAIVSTPGLDGVPRDLRPFPDRLSAGQITVGWLRDRVDSGQIESTHDVSPRFAAEALRRVALRVVSGPTSSECRPFRAGTRRMQAGDAVNFRGSLILQVRSPGGGTSRVQGLANNNGGRLEALLGPLDVQLAPYSPDTVECGGE